MRKLACILAATALLLSQLWADVPPAQIVKGEKGKLYIITGAGGSRNARVSADGRYVGGSFFSGETATSGYIYDVQEDTIYYGGAADFLVSPQWYAGGNLIYVDGQPVKIEVNNDSDDPYYSTSSIWAATPDLKYVASMAYELQVDPATGKEIYVNLPYLVDGKTGKIVKYLQTHWPMSPTVTNNNGHGARPDAISADGMIVAGHSSYPGIYNNWSPVFWDLEHDTSFFVGELGGDNSKAVGSLEAISSDGTIMAGSAGQKLILVRYDREAMTFTKEEIPFAPGFTYGFCTGVTQTGLVMTVQQTISSDPGSRKTFLYDIHTKESVVVEEYVKELYGLECTVPVFTAGYISNDGRMISGWSFQSGDVPFMISLEEDQIFAKPRNLQVEQVFNQMDVNLQWREPLKGQYTLLGYNVFCDSVQVNEQLLDANQLYFVHNDVEPGIHDYSVQAVYEEGSSDFYAPIQVMVIGAGGCYPVQEMTNSVIYNRFVNIYWGLPSQKMSASKSFSPVSEGDLHDLVLGGKAPGLDFPAPKSYVNQGLDLVRYAEMEGYGWSSFFVEGTRIFAASYNSNMITEYDIDNLDVVAVYTIAGIQEISNMVLVGDKIYLAAGRNEILVVDRETMTVSNRLKTQEDVEVQHLSYIPGLNQGKGGFAYGDWTNLYYCNMYGQALDPQTGLDVEGLVISGTAYHNGNFYVFSQTGTSMAELYTFNFQEGTLLGKKVLLDDPRLAAISPAYGFVAGGMTLSLLSDSTVVLSSMLQFNAVNSHLAMFEVESAPGLLGYNLYRNGEKVNPDGEYIQGLHFQQAVYEPGEYVYTVETVNKNGCTSINPKVKTTVVINPIGECTQPESLAVSESNRSAVLSWDYQGSDGPSLVGFNVYRDGELLKENLLDLKYLDEDLAVGSYLYKVEAYHDNSCVASDSVEIEITHMGSAMPPSNLKAVSSAHDGKCSVDLSWDLPYFETPLSIGYSNLPFNAVALMEQTTMYAAIGWDSAALDPYRDLYLVGMEFFIGEQIDSLAGVVFLNEEMVCMQPMDGRIRENDWNTIYFNETYSMDQPMEVVVGYKVTYPADATAVCAYDMGPGKTGYGDLYSVDGISWGTLGQTGMSANWCIRALVVKKRDVEKATAAALATKGTILQDVEILRWELSSGRRVESDRRGDGAVQLEGFHVYRNEEKITSEPMKDLSFKDTDLERGIYEYEVSAVYVGGEEKKSDILVIDLEDVSNQKGETTRFRVFPNPVRDGFYVQGEFSTLKIMNLNGVVVKETSYVEKVSVEDLAPGVYVLMFETRNGRWVYGKIVVQ